MITPEPHVTIVPLDLLNNIPYLNKGGVHTWWSTEMITQETGVSIRDGYLCVETNFSSPSFDAAPGERIVGEKEAEDGDDEKIEESTAAGSSRENSSDDGGSDISEWERPVRKYLRSDGSGRRDKKKEAASPEHHRNHKPAIPEHCDTCRRAKTRNKYRFAKRSLRECKKWEDVITMDHILMRDWYGRPGIGGYPDVLNLLDVATNFKYCEPVESKDTLDTYMSIKFCLGDNYNDHVQRICSDGFKSLKKATRQLQLNWEPSKPGVHQNNSKIERSNLDLEDGSRAACIGAGAPGCFWTYAAPYFAMVHNLTEDSEGITPWFRRHGEKFTGKVFPFLSAVRFKRSPKRGRPGKMEERLEYGVFTNTAIRMFYVKAFRGWKIFNLCVAYDRKSVSGLKNT